MGHLDVTLKQIPPANAFIWTWYGEIVVPQSIVDLLRLSGFGGYEAEPATVRIEGQDMTLAAMYELKVSGWGGFASPDSGVHLLEGCAGCGLRVYSCFSSAQDLIDPKAWDGSDLFVVWPAPRFVFATDRVVNALVSEGISGWQAEHLASVTCGTQLTPGRITDWFSQERVAQLIDEGRLPANLIC